MRKTMIICCLIIFLCFQVTTYAANIELNLEADKQNYIVEEQGQKIEIYVKLGDFINIPEKTFLGFSAMLTYDENVFENANVSAVNEWNILYNENSHVLQGDTQKANSNTTIAKIELKLKEQITKRNESTIIRLKNIIISDGNFEIKQEKEIEINITNSTVEETTQQIKEISVLTGENSLKAMTSSSENERLPNVGLQKKIIIAIVILLIAMIIFRIKARKIK